MRRQKGCDGYTDKAKRFANAMMLHKYVEAGRLELTDDELRIGMALVQCCGPTAPMLFSKTGAASYVAEAHHA